MWLATRYGFFSIVMGHGPGGAHEPHPHLMMIRARKHSHLAKLKALHEGLGQIVRNTGTDYPYRILADKDVVLLLVARLTAEINYTNFKNEAHDALPNDKAYHKFLMSVWGIGLKLTPAKIKRKLNEGFFGRRGYMAPTPEDHAWLDE